MSLNNIQERDVDDNSFSSGGGDVSDISREEPRNMKKKADEDWQYLKNSINSQKHPGLTSELQIKEAEKMKDQELINFHEKVEQLMDEQE
jgi:hypothetical protein